MVPRLSRIGCALGLVSLSVSFLYYESWNPVVCGRWSPSWIGVMVAAWLVSGAAILWAMGTDA